MVVTENFWDKIAPRYAKITIKNMDAYTQTLDRTRSYLGQEDSVLELGCGTGSTALLLAPGVGQITGADISGGMIAIARKKARDEEIANADFERAEVGSETLEMGAYDGVLAFNLLHLLDDVPQAIRFASARLKPGGYFISKTPCLAENGWHIRALVGLMRLVGKAPFVNFLRQDHLQQMVRDAGFEIVETGVFKGAPRSRFIVARKL